MVIMPFPFLHFFFKWTASVRIGTSTVYSSHFSGRNLGVLETEVNIIKKRHEHRLNGSTAITSVEHWNKSGILELRWPTVLPSIG